MRIFIHFALIVLYILLNGRLLILLFYKEEKKEEMSEKRMTRYIVDIYVFFIWEQFTMNSH